MSGRYGRNQRRAHREEIARLRALAYLGTVPAQPGDLVIDQMASPHDWAISIECQDRRIERTVRLMLLPRDRDFQKLLSVGHAGGYFSYQGGRYFLKGAMSPEDRHGMVVFYPVLAGVPR